MIDFVLAFRVTDLVEIIHVGFILSLCVGHDHNADYGCVFWNEAKVRIAFLPH